MMKSLAVLALLSLAWAANAAVTAGVFNIIPPQQGGSARVSIPAAPTTSTTSTVSAAGMPFGNNNNNNGGSNSGYNGNGNSANNAFYNGALSGYGNGNNNGLGNGGPWGSGSTVTADADTVINDNTRFNGAEMAGTWAIQASGFAHRPMHDKDGKLWAHPTFPLDTIAQDVPVDFTGLLCIDRNSGCTLEIIVNIGGHEAVIRQSDSSCQVSLHGNGQGFVRTNLVPVAGCDHHMAFPTSLVLPFVLGANGVAFFETSGCLFGLNEDPYFEDADTIPGVFSCMPAHSNSDEADVSGLAPITMSGTASRQNGQIRVNTQNAWGMNNGNGPWGNSGPLGTNTNNNGNGWGTQNTACNCNNWTSTNSGGSNPCNCRDQDHCLPFDSFLLPFTLHNANQPGTGTCTQFQSFQSGCIDPAFIIGGCSLQSEYSP